MRILPLNAELEKAALNAVFAGTLGLERIQIEELSKEGKVVYKTLKTLGENATYKQAVIAAVELHGGETDVIRPYLKEVYGASMGDIAPLLDALARKRLINQVVDEATDQISSGEYSLLAVRGLLEKSKHARSTLIPLCEEMVAAKPPPVLSIRSLPNLCRKVGGLFGLWVLGGGPGAGKSTLALQISMTVSAAHRPVLHYDIEQGKAVLAWHVHEAMEGNKAKIKEATSRLYVRESLHTLERDLDMLDMPVLVVVDSVQKIETNIMQRRESVESWVHKLEALKRYGHHIILVSEKNRASYGSPSISGYKETGEIEYAADTALDLMAVTSDNESPVEIHVTKNRHFKFKGFAGILHRERSWWFSEPKSVITREVD